MPKFTKKKKSLGKAAPIQKSLMSGGR